MEYLEPTQNERTMAALGHGLSFFEGGIIGPFILYLIERDKSEFSAFHSLQSLYWGLLWLAVSMFGIAFSLLLGLLTCGIGYVVGIAMLIGLLGIYLVFEVIAAVKAYNGEWYELPLVGSIAYQSHNPHKDG